MKRLAIHIEGLGYISTDDQKPMNPTNFSVNGSFLVKLPESTDFKVAYDRIVDFIKGLENDN